MAREDLRRSSPRTGSGSDVAAAAAPAAPAPPGLPLVALVCQMLDRPGAVDDNGWVGTISAVLNGAVSPRDCPVTAAAGPTGAWGNGMAADVDVAAAGSCRGGGGAAAATAAAGSAVAATVFAGSLPTVGEKSKMKTQWMVAAGGSSISSSLARWARKAAPLLVSPLAIQKTAWQSYKSTI